MRVFISHGLDKDETDQLAYLRALTQALRKPTPKKAKHEILVDDSGLQPGAEWEGVLLDCLDECDRALLLLTERALQRPWVWREAAILSFRQARSGGHFWLYPVLLGVGVQDVAAVPALNALGLQRLQAFKSGTTPAEVARFVHARLDEQPQAHATQLDQVANALAVQLRDANLEALGELCNELGGTLAFGAGTDPHRRCALAIARAIIAGRLHRVGGLHQLDSRLRFRCGVKEDERANIRELVAPLWVVSDAAVRLAQHVAGLAEGMPPHALALTTRRPVYSGRMVVHRQMLPDLPTADPLLPLTALADCGVDGVQRAMLEELEHRGFNQADGLEQLQDPLEPLYVLLPPQARDGPLLAELRGRFPRLVFLTVVGDTARDDLDPVVEPLPPLARPAQGLREAAALLQQYYATEKRHQDEYMHAGGTVPSPRSKSDGPP